MRLNKNSISKVNLADILRRRRKTLQQFIQELGIVSYDVLVSRCASMGVNPPPESDFTAIIGSKLPVASSPADGIVVLEIEPAKVIEEATGNDTEPEVAAPAVVSSSGSRDQNFSGSRKNRR